jgi:glycosyltransferase involved in cell wall biosynthesis
LDGRTGSSDGRRIAVREVLRRVRPEVVLPGAVVDAWVVTQESKSIGGPRIVYCLPGVNRNALAFIRQYAESIDTAFGVGPLTRDLLRTYCGMASERTFLVPTGVRPCSRPSSNEVACPIRLLFVGRFDSDKRILDALALADELISRKLEFTLTLVGSGGQSSVVEAAASRFGGRLQLKAPVTAEVLYQKLYPEADAILLFSPTEGLPNALLEGMAHGLVAITADFAGRHQLGLFQPGETAIVFDVGNMSAAANCIVDLAQTPGLKARIGANARRLIERERSVEKMVDAFETVLEASLAGPPAIGRVAPMPEWGESRLRNLLGPRGAEGLRRLLKRSFAHSDPSEWPLIDNIEPPAPDAETLTLRRAIEVFQERAPDATQREASIGQPISA